MSRPTKAARSLHVLDLEIRELRRKARQLEDQIDENFNHFQQHSGSMFIRSLLPRKVEGEAITGVRLLDTVLQNERLQKILLRLADRLAEQLGDALNWLANKVFKK